MSDRFVCPSESTIAQCNHYCSSVSNRPRFGERAWKVDTGIAVHLFVIANQTETSLSNAFSVCQLLFAV